MSGQSMSKQRRARIGIPLSVAAFISSWLLRRMRRSIAADEALRKKLMDAQRESGEDAPYNVEIFIHLSDVFKESFGHVDIALGDKVISYANYDDSKTVLFGAISDGVIAIVDKARYIDHALHSENKILIGFRLWTGRDYQAQMADKVHELCPVLEKWEPPYAAWERERAADQDAPSDGASTLYRDTGCEFWKVKKRKYRFFFCLNTNCVSFADELLGVIGIDKVRHSGTLSPGEYYAYLDSQLGLDGNSAFMVKEKHIYLDAEGQLERLAAPM
jgi:hypothetical protein